MAQDDLHYFTQREQQELSMATSAEDNAVALTHFKLADAYATKLRELKTASLGEEQRAAFEASGRPATSTPAFPLLRN